MSVDLVIVKLKILKLYFLTFRTRIAKRCMYPSLEVMLLMAVIVSIGFKFSKNISRAVELEDRSDFYFRYYDYVSPESFQRMK